MLASTVTSNSIAVVALVVGGAVTLLGTIANILALRGTTKRTLAHQADEARADRNHRWALAVSDRRATAYEEVQHFLIRGMERVDRAVPGPHPEEPLPKELPQKETWRLFARGLVHGSPAVGDLLERWRSRYDNLFSIIGQYHRMHGEHLGDAEARERWGMTADDKLQVVLRYERDLRTLYDRLRKAMAEELRGGPSPDTTDIVEHMRHPPHTWADVVDGGRRLGELVDEADLHDIVLMRGPEPVALLIAPKRYDDLRDRVEELEEQAGILSYRLETATNPDQSP